MEIEQLEELRPRLDEHLARFDECIKTSPSRRHLKTYVNGQLGPLERKSIEPIALDADVPVRSLQEFLEIHRWDEAKLGRRVREIVMDRHADPEAVGVIDETSFAKKGFAAIVDGDLFLPPATVHGQRRWRRLSTDGFSVFQEALRLAPGPQRQDSVMRNWLVREGHRERFIPLRAGFGEIGAPEAECRI